MLASAVAGPEADAAIVVSKMSRGDQGWSFGDDDIQLGAGGGVNDAVACEQ